MMNFDDLNQAQTAHVVEYISKMGEQYLDVCKDIHANREALCKVSKLIGDNISENVMKRISASTYIRASKMDNDIEKCRYILESWWTVSAITPQTISLALQCGGFNTEQHRAWISDVVGKNINELYMDILMRIYGEVIYAILYV